MSILTFFLSPQMARPKYCSVRILIPVNSATWLMVLILTCSFDLWRSKIEIAGIYLFCFHENRIQYHVTLEPIVFCYFCSCYFSVYIFTALFV